MELKLDHNALFGVYLETNIKISQASGHPIDEGRAKEEVHKFNSCRKDAASLGWMVQ